MGEFKPDIGNGSGEVKKDETKIGIIESYEDMDKEKVREILIKIKNSSKSEEEVRDRIMSELKYPYDKDGIAVSEGLKDSSGKLHFQVMIHGPDRSTINV